MMKQHPNGFLNLVSEAKQHIQQTDVMTVKARLDRQDPFALIDVREDLEWARGHCVGAVHIGKGVIERDIERLYPDREQELILYCGGGYRSALAAESLQKMGYSHVISMDGGFSSWCEQGYPVVID